MGYTYIRKITEHSCEFPPMYLSETGDIIECTDCGQRWCNSVFRWKKIRTK